MALLLFTDDYSYSMVEKSTKTAHNLLEKTNSKGKKKKLPASFVRKHIKMYFYDLQ